MSNSTFQNSITRQTTFCVGPKGGNLSKCLLSWMDMYCPRLRH